MFEQLEEIGKDGVRYSIIGILLCLFCPPLIPFYIISSGRHMLKGEYYDYGAKPFCASGTITLIVLTLFLWIPGVIVSFGFLIFNEIVYREDSKAYIPFNYIVGHSVFGYDEVIPIENTNDNDIELNTKEDVIKQKEIDF
eukprot:gene174-4420_t